MKPVNIWSVQLGTKLFKYLKDGPLIEKINFKLAKKIQFTSAQ